MNTRHTTRTRSTTSTAFRYAFVFGVTTAAAVVAMSPASAARPTDGPGSASSAVQPSASHAAVSSPCFAVRTPDRWPNDVGAQPQCTHVFGASVSFGVSAAWDNRSTREGVVSTGAQQERAYAARNDMPDQETSAMDSPCFMNPMHWQVAFDGGRPVCSTR